MREPCDFCNAPADYMFDMEWDAFLCWLCHLAQNTRLFMLRYRVSRYV